MKHKAKIYTYGAVLMFVAAVCVKCWDGEEAGNPFLAATFLLMFLAGAEWNEYCNRDLPPDDEEKGEPR